MSPMFGMQGSQIALLLGVGLIFFVILKRVRRGFGDSTTYRSDASGGSASRSATASKRQESWEVEMHALARQLKGEIDTKMQALERLIQMADEAQIELATAIERADSLGSPTGRRLDTATATVEERVPDRFGSAPAGSTVSNLALASKPRGSVSSVRLHTEESLGDDPRFERVFALADAGFPAARIASQVGSQVGEVELILSLRRA